MGFRVVLDTCILVPAALRDTLLRAAVRDLYEVYWSNQILAELERVLVREEMTTEDKARHLVETLRTQFPNALILDSYTNLIQAMENDEKDRHVLAAAVRMNAQTIVTENVRHFPSQALDPYGIEAQTPDTFLVHLFYIDPEDMCESIIRQAEALKHGDYTVTMILDNIGYHAPRFTALVRDKMAQLSHLARRLEELERRE